MLAMSLLIGAPTVEALVTGRTDEQLLFLSPTSASGASSTVSVAPMVSKTTKGAGWRLVGEDETSGRPMRRVLVENWFEELKRLVPTN